MFQCLLNSRVKWSISRKRQSIFGFDGVKLELDSNTDNIVLARWVPPFFLGIKTEMDKFEKYQLVWLTILKSYIKKLNFEFAIPKITWWIDSNFNWLEYTVISTIKFLCSVCRPRDDYAALKSGRNLTFTLANLVIRDSVKDYFKTPILMLQKIVRNLYCK